MKQEPWQIQICSTGIPTCIFVTDGNVAKIAQLLSTTTIEDIQLIAHARIRRVYKNGEIVSDHPNLEVFYSNMSSDDLYAWKSIQAFPASYED